MTIYNFTGETIATYYESIMFHVESPEAANNLTAKIAVSAINKCENVTTLHPSEPSFLNKGIIIVIILLFYVHPGLL